LADTVLIRLAPGAARAAVARRLHAVSAAHPGVTVGDQRDLEARADHAREANDWLFRILAVIVFAFTAIAVVNTLSMIAVHRTRELGLLRLIGATPAQVRSMSRWEAALVAGLGVGAGAAIGLVTLMPTAHELTGSPWPYAPPALVALVLASAAGVAVIGTQLATRVAMRPRPVDAIGVRD
jgi:putative ABC transport system permease protein